MGSTPAAFIVQPPLLCSLTYDHDLITARGKSPFQCLPLLLQALNSFVLLQSVSQSRRIPKGWNLNFGGWNIGPRCQVFSNLDQAEHEPNHPNPKDELLYYLLLSLLFKPWLAVSLVNQTFEQKRKCDRAEKRQVRALTLSPFCAVTFPVLVSARTAGPETSSLCSTRMLVRLVGHTSKSR